jgi:hypothetical protein
VNPVLLTWVALILVAVAGIWVFLRRSGEMGEGRSAPGPGKVLGMGLHEMAALDAVWADRKGFLVWSSTMHGQHDLVRMDWPGGQLTRLTSSPNVDTMPKISPNGRQVAFARSRKEWVSAHNLEEWEIWVLNFKTGEEKRVAERGAAPAWTADGKALVFQRGGREIVQMDLKSGEETALLGPRPERTWTEPYPDPAGERIAATVLGKRRHVALFAIPNGVEQRVAAGGQMSFLPAGAGLVLLAEEGGRMQNRICRADGRGGNLHPWFDMPGFWSREYSPRVANDGSLLVFSAARDEGASDTADFEIFLWQVGEPWERAARVSFHTGNDQWPDVWVSPPPPPKKSGK